MKYQLRNGEHVREIAEHFGFSSTKTIADHPDNASVVSERGGIDHLVPGDVFTIPEGTSGRRQLGTGRGHDLTVSATPGTFVVKLESAFRLRNGFGTPDGEHHGNLADSPNRWAGFGKQNLTVIGATITVSQSGGGLIFTNITNRKGEAVFPHLDDGRWVVSATPDDNELSPGAARAAPGVDHGLGFYEKKGKPVGKPQRPFPANGTYEVEYRPVELELTVSGGAIESATMDDESVPLPAPDAGPPTPPERPPPAVPFWRGIGEGGDRQALHLDWKPDFIRRVKRKLRPFQRERKSVGQLDRDTPELVAVHQTTGDSIGSSLHTFLPPGSASGAHFLNDLDGHVVRMADDRYFTQHAGGYNKKRAPNWNLAEWDAAGTRNKALLPGDLAVGIENVHKENTVKAEAAPEHHPFTEAQYASLRDLIKGYRETYPNIRACDVVGHQDLTPKARCPGPHFEWEKIEGEDGALAMTDPVPGENETMFGGFFAGKDGAARVLKEGDEERREDDGSFTVLRGKETVAGGLTAGPVSELADALRAIGYGVDVKIKTKKPLRYEEGEVGRVLLLCLAQFMRRYCSGSRQRLDQYPAYLEVDIKKNSPRVTLDIQVAQLVVRVQRAANEARGL